MNEKENNSCLLHTFTVLPRVIFRDFSHLCEVKCQVFYKSTKVEILLQLLTVPLWTFSWSIIQATLNN